MKFTHVKLDTGELVQIKRHNQLRSSHRYNVRYSMYVSSWTNVYGVMYNYSRLPSTEQILKSQLKECLKVISEVNEAQGENYIESLVHLEFDLKRML